uniref:Uncharacterized protein n=1 Tax=Acrobeloides nanus TaxID=290746 RepID=A0A914EE36_9BILA
MAPFRCGFFSIAWKAVKPETTRKWICDRRPEFEPYSDDEIEELARIWSALEIRGEVESGVGILGYFDVDENAKDPSLVNEEDSVDVMDIEDEELNFVQAEVMADLTDLILDEESEVTINNVFIDLNTSSALGIRGEVELGVAILEYLDVDENLATSLVSIVSYDLFFLKEDPSLVERVASTSESSPVHEAVEVMKFEAGEKWTFYNPMRWRNLNFC